ncbi:MAG: TIGR02757 family protein [Bacteroidales bacterium]|nr:TIGR02757 family protein [Bacteroidales bacterium]
MDQKLKQLLDEAYHTYNNPEFIADDPIQIPHQFQQKEDIEISGFLAAVLAWGQRKTIIKKAEELIRLMDGKPYYFITTANEKDYSLFYDFRHRTFNGDDCVSILLAIAHLYNNLGGLEQVFTQGFRTGGAYTAINSLFDEIFKLPHLKRTQKHIARPSQGSAAKRINMFLRWMVRKDDKGVDFGLWNGISTAELVCPLDLHSGRMARQLGLLTRKQNDWKAAIELTHKLKVFDPIDPVKYDFALFGASMYQHKPISEKKL